MDGSRIEEKLKHSSATISVDSSKNGRSINDVVFSKIIAIDGVVCPYCDDDVDLIYRNIYRNIFDLILIKVLIILINDSTIPSAIRLFSI